jgi:mono/diheme cytochrome c family protein
LKFVAVIVVVAAGAFAFQANQLSVRAAQQSANPGLESATKTGAQPMDPGAQSYAQHCAICHGDAREGILPGFPPLTGIKRQMSDDKIIDLIHNGKGRMPGFPRLQNGELTALLKFVASTEPSVQSASGAAGSHLSGLAEAGGELFHQNCAFCHGRDAMGGESGPDLTQSKLVLADKTGEKIAEVTREGKPDNKMPAFNFSSEELASLIAFIHAREADAALHKGSRRGVDVADLQTGNAEVGMQYFKGAGGCVKCHSPSGDLSGIATRYEGLKLEQRMLYPRDAKSSVTVTLASGQKVTGRLAYLDEFTVALRDSTGVYHSWATSRVHYTVDSPVNAHVELFSKYTDDDIHNLMAYLQTLR